MAPREPQGRSSGLTPTRYLLAKAESCRAAHVGYFVSRQLKLVIDHGEQMKLGPGDFVVMPAGHDAWIVGDEPWVVTTGMASPTSPRGNRL